MKRTILLTSLITILLFSIAILITNYFIGYGYYLPHKTMVIYTWESSDIFARAEPQYIALTEEPPNDGRIYFPAEEPKPPIIKSLYPCFGIDNTNQTWNIIFESEYLSDFVPDDFPYETKFITVDGNRRLTITVPMIPQEVK